jgi:hypothetical protein
MQTADKIMEQMLATYKERKAVYGDNYLIIGNVMEKMFPDGVVLKTAEDHNKWHLFLMAMVKATRLANTNLSHIDSAHDAAVYMAMLEGMMS